MKITIELRVHIEGQSWAMRIDGHEWDAGLTTTDVQQAVSQHVLATMGVLVAEQLDEKGMLR